MSQAHGVRGVIDEAVPPGAPAVARYAQLQGAMSQPDPEPQYAAPPAPAAAAAPDYAAELEQLAKLKAEGILSEEEFEAKKAELLGRL